MTKKEKVKYILNFLKENYEKAKCSLNYKTPFQLLVATRLSAQCTDKKVNKVTKTLFLKYKTINSFKNANLNEIKQIIKPCGLFNKKAYDIILASSILIEKFNANIPNNLKDLLSLPGIGRKSANLILAEIFKKPAIIVDTHLIRISNRLKLVKEKNPKKIELSLLKIIPKKETINFCHRIVFFGRDLCKAKKPICLNCKLKIICKNV